MNPAETATPGYLARQPRGPADRDMVRGGQVRGLGAHLRAVLRPAGHARGRLAA